MLPTIYAESKNGGWFNNKSRMHSPTGILLLAALVMGVFLVTGPLASAASISFIFASTTTEGGGEGNDGENNSNEGNNEDSNHEGGGSEEPETEPEPPIVDDKEPPPAGPIESFQPPAIIEEPPSVVPGEPIRCPTGSMPNSAGNQCIPDDDEVIPPALPICDGTFQDCITENGDICLAGQGGHECECAEDMSDCPNHPSLPPPLESPSPDPLPYCDLVEDDPSYTGPCHDRQDFDDITGLYPCNDGTQEEDWRDCGDAYVPPEQPCDPATDINCESVSCIPEDPEPCVPQCKEGFELENGKCGEDDGIDCPPGYDKVSKNECKKEITIIVNQIVQNTKDNNNHGHGNFPAVDIIGLSTKQNGDSMVCLINIDNDNVQCQEFGMPQDRVNGDFWRVIETDHDKDYDNGNTGSNNIDGIIENIKSQDFSELEEDTNHDFNIDLAWIAINPQGDGVVCLSQDSTGKGKSLCEPFKVSAQEIDGQITEGIAIENS